MKEVPSLHENRIHSGRAFPVHPARHTGLTEVGQRREALCSPLNAAPEALRPSGSTVSRMSVTGLPKWRDRNRKTASGGFWTRSVPCGNRPEQIHQHFSRLFDEHRVIFVEMTEIRQMALKKQEDCAKNRRTCPLALVNSYVRIACSDFIFLYCIYHY